MPTRKPIDSHHVHFPSHAETWAEKEALREYYNAKQEEDYRRRKEHNQPKKEEVKRYVD